MSPEEEKRLQKIVQDGAAANLKLRAVEAAREREVSREFVGKCFKYRNCYSCPETEADYWWLYAVVTHVGEVVGRVFEFQRDSRGEIKIDLDYAWYPSDSWIEIEIGELDDAWGLLTQQLPVSPWQLVRK